MAEEKTTVVERIYSVAALALVFIFLLLVFSIVRTSIFGQVEEEKHVYFEIVFLLLLAVLAEMAVFYLKQQSVIILMLLGMVMSASFMGLMWGFLLSLNLPFSLPPNPPEIIRDQGVIAVFAQLGAVILLFKVGLHSRIERIFSKENMMVATAGVVLPFVCGYLYASMTGGDFAYSMFVGAALTATSVGVTVAILKDMGLLGKRFAEVIIGAAVIDDVLGLLVLSIVINATSAEGGALASVATTFLTVLVFMAGAVLASRYFIKYYDRKEMGARRFLIAM
ncbi:cation:proton antiporter, partial [Candidatus Micrarchaeota archaeon]|nr:cation:proton antiporter [Candidatus Micrarchaeota archaeon]